MLLRGLLTIIYIIVVFLLRISHASERMEMGPYEIVGQRVMNCPMVGERQVEIESKSMKKVLPDTYDVRLKVASNISIGENISGKMSMAKKEGDTWIENWIQDEFSDLCAYFKRLLPTLLQAFLDFFEQEDCPFPPIESKEANMRIVLKTNMPSVPYGDYRMDLLLQDGDTSVGCWRLCFAVIPKKGPSKRTKTKNS